MPPKKQKSANVKRLAKSVRADQTRARTRRARKNTLRPQHGGDAGGTVGDEREVSAFARLIAALQKEGIRLQVIGMSAAILHGVPGTTQDVDLWIDLSPRDYMRVINAAVREGAEFVRNTVVALSDQILVNFVYQVTGLQSFASEYRKAKKFDFHGVQVPVLALESIEKSKRAIGRAKDLTHLQQIADFKSCQKEEKRAIRGKHL
jgi:hypothetical protein